MQRQYTLLLVEGGHSGCDFSLSLSPFLSRRGWAKHSALLLSTLCASLSQTHLVIRAGLSLSLTLHTGKLYGTLSIGQLDTDIAYPVSVSHVCEWISLTCVGVRRIRVFLQDRRRELEFLNQC